MMTDTFPVAAPRVSILMLVYDRSHTIGRAIQSACCQTFQQWEMIIVQDGSNPELRPILTAWQETEPRIRYFARGTVGSIAEASNFGLQQAHGQYVAIMDDDDYWCAVDKLARQVEFLDTHPEYVACGTGYVVVDGLGKQRGRYIKPKDDGDIRSRALIANPIANSTSVYRRIVGGMVVTYDTQLQQFADWDFWLVMGCKGKLYNLPEYLTCYTLWHSGSSFRHQRANARAAIQIVRKHRSSYQGFPLAFILASLYFCYAQIPAPLRRRTYEGLSALKKAFTGMRDVPARL